jgi:hypothetical protein
MVNNRDLNFKIDIKTINVAKSDFAITVKMWVSKFTILRCPELSHILYGVFVCCACISVGLGDCAIQNYFEPCVCVCLIALTILRT